RKRLIEAPRDHKAMGIRPSTGAASGKSVATLKGVGKRYGERVVLSDVDLLLFRGERIGLLGPNGAGQSTLLKMLAAIAALRRGAPAPQRGEDAARRTNPAPAR